MTAEHVLVTGATGFIGLHVLHRTLLAGHTVRAAIRTASGEERILSALKRAGLPSSYNSKLTFVIVPDIIAASAYDHVLDGIDSIIHVASPLVQATDNYKADVVDPAVNGTTNILNAAQKHGGIRRIVITSSIVTLVDVPTMNPEHVYSEKDKATTVNYDNKTSNPFIAYVSSKILAHKAVYDFLAEHKERSFDVATVHPSFVWGHNYVQTEYNADRAPGTNYLLWSVVAPSTGQDEGVDPSPQTTVSVIDVADAHVRGLTVKVEDRDKPEEFLLATPWEQVRFDKIEEIVRKLAEEDEEVKSVLGDLKFRQKTGFTNKLDVSKTETKLNIKFRTFEEQVGDVVKQQVGFYKEWKKQH